MSASQAECRGFESRLPLHSDLCHLRLIRALPSDRMSGRKVHLHKIGHCIYRDGQVYQIDVGSGVVAGRRYTDHLAVKRGKASSAVAGIDGGVILNKN